MFRRILNPLLTNSFFLFGARGTGKTTLLNQRLPSEETLTIDLLDPDTEDRLSRHPAELSERLAQAPGNIKWIFIDEIQKIPKLLDVVHWEIENSRFKFALTGSSARKLKRGSANLLAGRAFVNYLFPLTHLELAENFNLGSALKYGTLPKLTMFKTEEERQAFLRAYVLTYIKEEIKEEQVVRKLAPFRRFLEVAAQVNGEILNYTNIGRDVGVDTKTVQSYFHILEDTLLGVILEPFHLSVRKRQSKNPKFYFMDPGVKRALDRTLTVDLVPRTYAYGKAFEHFIIVEILRLNSYLQKDYRFSYLRTKDNAEIDLIIERPGMPMALIEIKSTHQVAEKDIGSLKRFSRDFQNCEAFCLSLDATPRMANGIKILPWSNGLQELGLIL